MVDAHDADIGSVVDELNRRNSSVYDPAVKVAHIHQFTFVKGDFTQNNTNNPRNPWIDWTCSKSFAHGLGYVPYVRALFTVLPYYASATWFTLPQLPFTVYDSTAPTIYQNKYSSGIYLTVDSTYVTANYTGNFFNPLDPTTWGGIDQTAYINCAILAQPVG